jgi:uncharacterized protein DUF4037
VTGFTRGIELSGAFYREAVRPLLGGRSHAAALLGWGSDVLGFDTPRSTDHGWGPRLLLFVDAAEAPDVSAAVSAGLPDTFGGRPVRYGWDDVAEDHHVTVTSLPAWLVEQLGVDATRGLTLADWLVTPQQRLLGVVGGAVYADDRGELERVRHALAWYPDQVWRWLLACQWRRLAQEEAFVQRTAEVGDELGSAVTAARLVRDAMRLALLLARRYAPYGKWLGSAFAQLDAPDDLTAHLQRTVAAADLESREAALAAAYVALAERHNASGLTEPLDPRVRPFHDRPAQVLMADRFAEACRETVTDPALRAMPLIGGIDQFADSTDVLSDPAVYRRLAPALVSLSASPAA